MRLVFFNDFVFGVMNRDQVVDASAVVKDVPHVTKQDLLAGIITNFDSLKGDLAKLAASGKGVPASQVRLRQPLPKPTHMVCMAANYMESGSRATKPQINAFLKSASSLIGNGDTILLPPAKANIFHHEAELGLVIGKEADNVSKSAAFDYIFGYVNFIDGSARGAGPGFFWGKSWDTFGPMGPCIVTKDEVADPQNLNIRLWVNGQLRQDFTTADMAYDIPTCIEWATAITTLEPGDMLATGTNHQGLGAMQDGDVIEIEVANFGRLRVNVRDDLKREWPRGIDSATADRAAGRVTAGGFGEPAR
jgi:2-keto-4-pentenoate hydratase/2-oxohepta-3-ene-1,7-dioic acid hydratase in catechol pathway